MPPKPHFLTEAESTNLRAKHLIMPEEDQRWLQTHLDRINETMQYHIQGRTSMDDALRLFLMADKGFTLQQAIEMRDISPAQMKAYYQEFIETYANPEKTGEENMYLLGGMHSRALKKIQEFRFPNYHNVKSIADFTRVYAFFTVLNGIMTSLSQDTQISDPGLNLAYYAGAGGKSNLKKLAQPIDNACYQVTVMLQFLDYDKFDYPVDTTAQYLKLCKNQIVKYSNKTIGEMKIPVLFSNDAVQRIAFNGELM